MGIFIGQLKRHFWSNIHKALAFLCIAAFGTFIILSPIYAAVAVPVALTYGLTIAIPAVFFLIASVCRMFCNPKYINKNVAQKIVHRGKIFYNLGLSALGIGLFFIGVLCCFFPGLVALAGLSSLAWIIGLTSGGVGIFFIYRSYKNLRTGSISDIKRYTFEIMGHNNPTSTVTNKILQIVRRTIESLGGIAKKDKNQSNKDASVEKEKRLLTEDERRIMDCLKSARDIRSIMDKCQYILIFKIIYKSNPEVNKDGYNQKLTEQDETMEKSITNTVNDHKQLICDEILQSSENDKMEAVSKILDNMSNKIKDIGVDEEIKNQIDNVIRLTGKVIEKTLSDNNIENKTFPEIEDNLIAIDGQINDNNKNGTNSQINDNNKMTIEKTLSDNNIENKISPENGTNSQINDNNKMTVEEYQLEELLNAHKSSFSVVDKLNLNQAQELNNIGIYQYFCDYRNELQVMLSAHEDKNVQELLDSLVRDLDYGVPSAKNNKILRNVFLLLLGIILTFGGALSFIYPTLLAFIGLSGLLGELFAIVVITCGLSLVYESIKNFIFGTVVGFERSSYELIASNCNDSDKKKICNEVVRRLGPLRPNNGDVKFLNEDINQEEEPDCFDGEDEIDKNFYAVLDPSKKRKNSEEYENNVENVENESSCAQQESAAKLKDFKLKKDEDDTKDVENEDNDENENEMESNDYTKPLTLPLPDENNDDKTFKNQKYLISEQTRLLQLSATNVDELLFSTEEKVRIDKENKEFRISTEEKVRIDKENKEFRINKILEKKFMLDKERTGILSDAKDNTNPIIHTANFIIKQNHIKLQPIIQKALSELGYEPQDNSNILKPQCGGGVGGAKEHGAVPLTHFINIKASEENL